MAVLAPPNPAAGERPDLTAAARPLRIVALGDSLTSGHRLSRQDAYPAVLQQLLDEAGLPCEVLNHGVSGDTTAGGLRRLDAALAERPQILIVALGANDGLRGVPVAQVRANLDTILRRTRERGIQAVLVGMEALPRFGWQYTLDFHAMFPELARQHRTPLVPFMLADVFGDSSLMSADHVHPNAAGARVIARNIFTYVRPLAEAVPAE
jgi:acyl-CoA thioesterase-1